VGVGGWGGGKTAGNNMPRNYIRGPLTEEVLKRSNACMAPRKLKSSCKRPAYDIEDSFHKLATIPLYNGFGESRSDNEC